MILRWLQDKKVVDGSTLKPGKDLRMEAVGDGGRPHFFTVFQTYGPAYALVRRILGGAERTYQTAFLAKRVDHRKYQSDKEWRLPVPIGQISAQFIFVAEPSGKESGIVRSSVFGVVKFGWSAGLDMGALAGLTPVPAPEAEITVTVPVILGVDPLVRLDLLTGEDLAQLIINRVVKDLAQENNDVRRNPAYSEVLEGLIAACTPPDDWTYTLDAESAEIEPGTETAFTFTLRVSSPGTGAFVVWCRDSDHPFDDDKGTLSDVLAFKWEDGRLFASPVPVLFDND
jgi:hypothetical protein